MTRPTTLLAAGLLLAGATAARAQEPATSAHPAQPSATATAPVAPSTADTTRHTTPVVDTIWESSPTQRSRADIKEVQTWLAELNLYDRSRNGSMNPDTHEALRKFQRTHNLPVTGQVSDTLMVLLRKAAAAAVTPASR
jgi:peptidoglycan hydrolase-like protein with peptidoglycan-binding domain